MGTCKTPEKENSVKEKKRGEEQKELLFGEHLFKKKKKKEKKAISFQFHLALVEILAVG